MRLPNPGFFDQLSRRRVLRDLAALAAAAPLRAVAGSLLPAGEVASVRPVFEEVPAAESGIHWVHTAGKSAAKHLPETSGAGCAFLDYDNDGWMDIYLVNSGRSEFYTPSQPLRNALYRNNRDGTFTETRHPRVAVVDRGLVFGSFGGGEHGGIFRAADCTVW